MASDYRIERYPEGIEKRHRLCKYPFRDLKAGQGFIYDEQDSKRVRAAVGAWNRRNPDAKLIMRTDEKYQRWVIHSKKIKNSGAETP